jgi:hypothetical protein
MNAQARGGGRTAAGLHPGTYSGGLALAGLQWRAYWPGCHDPGTWASAEPGCRARDLTASADTGAGSSPFDAGHLDDAFLGWYAARHDDVPEAVAAATGTILDEWGLHENPDERSFYACSPHRIEMAAHLIREGCFADYANPALRLLPEWTEWCIEQSGLNGDAAARSRKAARSAASVLVDAEDDEPATEDDKAPFRRHE